MLNPLLIVPIMPSCSKFLSYVVLICACGLILSWVYCHNAWVICALICGWICRKILFAMAGCLKDFTCLGSGDPTVISQLEIPASCAQYSLGLHTWHKLELRPTRPDASLLLSQPLWKVLPFLLHKGGGVYIGFWALASHFTCIQTLISDFHWDFMTLVPCC